jgi:hypothetical protein
VFVIQTGPGQVFEAVTAAQQAHGTLFAWTGGVQMQAPYHACMMPGHVPVGLALHCFVITRNALINGFFQE